MFSSIEQELAMWEEYGPDTLALAELLSKYADYTYAVSQGFTMTDEEVYELVADLKRDIEPTFPISTLQGVP